MKRVSIKDIAKRAGVVPSTVSLVLNGKSKEMRISDELAEKIKALAKETGYQPNYTAVSLRTGRTKIIGLIVEDISNVFFSTLAKTIEDEVYSLGYKIVYCSTENNDDKGNELVRTLFHQQLEGFLITPSTGMANEVAKLVEHRKPVVLMDRYFSELDVPYVLVDNQAGVEEGMLHLFAKGYQRIAFVTVDLDQIQMKERERSYRNCMRQRGYHDLVLKLPYTIKSEAAVEQIATYISTTPDLEAIFFATNYLGINGLEGIKKLQLAIPGDLAIICFDDHDIFRFYTPGITVVKQPIHDIATTAIQLLMKQFEKKQLSPEELHIVKKPKLVVRAST